MQSYLTNQIFTHWDEHVFTVLVTELDFLASAVLRSASISREILWHFSAKLSLSETKSQQTTVTAIKYKLIKAVRAL